MTDYLQPHNHRFDRLPDEFIYDLEEKFEALNDIRLRSGYTQAQLARLLGVKPNQISKWERGETHPTFPTLVNLTRWLDLQQIQLAQAQYDEDLETDGDVDTY